ncbi:hypothetical protein ISCGN_030072 [Ixodes scapularis]
MGGGRQPWLHTPKTRQDGAHTHETNARKAERWTPTRPPRAIELVVSDAARRDDHPFAIAPHPNLNECESPSFVCSVHIRVPHRPAAFDSRTRTQHPDRSISQKPPRSLGKQEPIRRDYEE